MRICCLILVLVFLCTGCDSIGIFGDDNETAVVIHHNESGCSLNEIFVYPQGGDRGTNHGTISDGESVSVSVEPGSSMTVWASSNSSTSNIFQGASRNVTPTEGNTLHLYFCYKKLANYNYKEQLVTDPIYCIN